MDEAIPLELPRSTGRSVLIVDADERAGVALQRYLETEGWTVRHVRDGRAALRLWSTFPPSIVLTNCDGQEIDAFELAAFARRTKERPSCLLLTRQAESKVLQPAMMRRLGLAAVLRRPCPFDAIAAMLEQLQLARVPAGTERSEGQMVAEQVAC